VTRERWLFITAVATVVATHFLALLFAAAETFEVFVQVLVAVIALVLVYLALSAHVDRLAQSVEELKNYVHGYLKAPIYETEPRRVTSHLEELVTRSNEFIYAVGGRARDADYLEAIANKVREGKEHVRVVTGDHIQHALHHHLQELLVTYDPDDPDSPYHVGWYLDERFGHFTVTEAEVLISASNPLPRTPLQSVLRIRDPALSSRYKDYVHRLYHASARVDRDSPLLNNLCEDCSPVMKEVRELKHNIRNILQGVS
jgi:hypothetical protein